MRLTTFLLKILRYNFVRTLLLFLAVFLSISVVTFSLAFVYRVKGSIALIKERLGADIVIVPSGARTEAEDLLVESKIKKFYMKKDLLERLKVIKGIDKMTYQTYLTTLSAVCCDIPEILVVVYDPETDFVVTPWLKKKVKRALSEGEAIAGAESAFNIGLGLVDISLFGNRFKIVGTLEKTGTGLDTAIFITERELQRILKIGKIPYYQPGKISLILAKVKEGYDPAEVAKEIENLYVEVDTITRKELGKSVLSTLNDFERLFVLVIALTLCQSLLLIWSTYSAIINERKIEIGMIKSFGATNLKIIKIFILEGLSLTFLASLTGIVLGLIFYFILSDSFYIFRQLPASLTILHLVFISLLSLSLGIILTFLGALFPILRLKAIEPYIIVKT